MKTIRGKILTTLLALGLLAACWGFANVNTPIQEDTQGITSPAVELQGPVTENWGAALAQAEIGVMTGLLPNMALADIDPDNPVPNYGPYPHLFKDGDNVSFTMLDRALSQQKLVEGQQQIIVALQAQAVETAKVATHLETLTTSGINATVVQDNATLIAALQQLLQTLQTGQTF